MIEKLRSHLIRKAKGFTLVELLVVIAIIAILVLLVIVAINPIERIRDANDRNAQNEVRQGATAVTACITKELGDGVDVATVFNNTTGPCRDAATLQTNKYISNSASLGDLTFTWDATADAEDVCLTHPNTAGHDNVGWAYSTGQVSNPEDGAYTCP